VCHKNVSVCQCIFVEETGSQEDTDGGEETLRCGTAEASINSNSCLLICPRQYSKMLVVKNCTI
jgi:hypothetical protein